MFFFKFAVLLICKGMCIRFDKTGGGKQSVYELGYKRCSGRNVFFRFDCSRCPCCHFPLRSKRRHY